MTDALSMFTSIVSKDLFTLMQELNGCIDRWADKLNWHAAILYGAAILLSILFGCLAYKLRRPLIALLLAGGGYLLGCELYLVMEQSADWMPTVLAPIFGSILAIIFFSLACAVPSVSLVLTMGVLGGCVASFYLDSVLLICGAALLLAFLAALIMRTTYILVTSCVASLFTVSFVGGMLPSVKAFQLATETWYSFLIAGGLFVVYLLIQFEINRYRRERLH